MCVYYYLFMYLFTFIYIFHSKIDPGTLRIPTAVLPCCVPTPFDRRPPFSELLSRAAGLRPPSAGPAGAWPMPSPPAVASPGAGAAAGGPPGRSPPRRTAPPLPGPGPTLLATAWPAGLPPQPPRSLAICWMDTGVCVGVVNLRWRGWEWWSAPTYGVKWNPHT